MSIFGNILEKLGLKHPAAPQAPEKPAAPATPPSTTTVASQAPAKPAAPATPPPSPAPFMTPQNTSYTPTPQSREDFHPDAHFAPMERPQPIASSQPASAAIPEVDVVSKLEKMAAANPQQLDWKVSIVDLLKLLGLDSSYSSRKELATELGCPADLMNDSASMNTWLHKIVLQKLAENGGNIPKDLLG